MTGSPPTLLALLTADTTLGKGCEGGLTVNRNAADADAPAWLARRYSHVLLDPPRAGALAMLPHIARLAPERLLYVACDPDSLARDVGLLVHQHGFELLAAGVVDMFPHTAHLESIALLAPGAARGH